MAPGEEKYVNSGMQEHTRYQEGGCSAQLGAGEKQHTRRCGEVEARERGHASRSSRSQTCEQKGEIRNSRAEANK